MSCHGQPIVSQDLLGECLRRWLFQAWKLMEFVVLRRGKKKKKKNIEFVGVQQLSDYILAASCRLVCLHIIIMGAYLGRKLVKVTKIPRPKSTADSRHSNQSIPWYCYRISLISLDEKTCRWIRWPCTCICLLFLSKGHVSKPSTWQELWLHHQGRCGYRTSHWCESPRLWPFSGSRCFNP